MPHHARVIVPVEQAGVVLDALVSTYGVRADGLAQAAGRTDPAALQQARAALLEADTALDAYGWPPTPPLACAELTGSPRLIEDVLTAALEDTGHTLETHLEAYGRGELQLTDLRRAHEDLAAVMRLFLAHEEEHAV